MEEEINFQEDGMSENPMFQRKFSVSPIYERTSNSEPGITHNISTFQGFTKFGDIYKLTIPCSLCKEEVRPYDFFDHKKQHKAMAVMGYKVTDADKIERHKVIVHRNVLISTLIEAFLYSERNREKIDSACELLRKHKVPAYYKILSNSFNSSVHLRKTDNPLVNAIAICEDQNKSWRPVMEDRYQFVDKFGKKPNVCFFGLFDGHHGSVAAETTAVELPKFLLDQLAQYDLSYTITKREQRFVQSFDTVFREAYKKQESLFSSQKRNSSPSPYDYEWIHRAFAKAFWRMDRVLKLGRKEVSNFYWSGCSAVTCLLEYDEHFGSSSSWQNAYISDEPEKEMLGKKSFELSKKFENNFGVLHIANVGNVKVVLCKSGKAHLLTKEHTTQSLSERQRVLSEGGIISSNEPNGYTEGIMRITRGLGFHGNPNLRKSVIPVPQTISVPIDDTCQFLIAATVGLWDVLDKDEATAIAMSLFSMYEEIYKISKQETDKPPQHKAPFLPVSASVLSVEDSEIRLLYRNTSAFLESMAQDSTEEISEASSRKASSATLEEASKSKLNSKTEIPRSRPFYLYGVEDSDETDSSASHESSNSSTVQRMNKNFFDYAAEYVSRGLVNAALTAGSRENITVLVLLLNGCGYQLRGSGT